VLRDCSRILGALSRTASGPPNSYRPQSRSRACGVRIFAAEGIRRDVLGADAGHAAEDLGDEVVVVLCGVDVFGHRADGRQQLSSRSSGPTAAIVSLNQASNAGSIFLPPYLLNWDGTSRSKIGRAYLRCLNFDAKQISP
jgi:hypothetical protein